MSNKNKRWTSREESTLIELYNDNCTTAEIADLLERTPQAVHNRIHKLRVQARAIMPKNPEVIKRKYEHKDNPTKTWLILMASVGWGVLALLIIHSVSTHF